MFFPIFLTTRHVYEGNKSWNGRRVFGNVDKKGFLIPKTRYRRGIIYLFFVCFSFLSSVFFLFRAVVVTRISGVPSGVYGLRDETSGNKRTVNVRGKQRAGQCTNCRPKVGQRAESDVKSANDNICRCTGASKCCTENRISVRTGVMTEL